MRLGWMLCGLGLWAGAAQADWQDMTGPQITEALSGHSLRYENATQEFHASGRTLYNAGADSWGYWRIEGDRYCSQWPPADGWACYAMARDSETGALRFQGASGDMTIGRPIR